MARERARRRHAELTRSPEMIKPQLTRLGDEAREWPWLHENQIRRLPHARAPRPGRGLAADPDGARLDAQIPSDRYTDIITLSQAGLSRWRAVRHPAGRHDLLQHRPSTISTARWQ